MGVFSVFFAALVIGLMAGVSIAIALAFFKSWWERRKALKDDWIKVAKDKRLVD